MKPAHFNLLGNQVLVQLDIGNLRAPSPQAVVGSAHLRIEVQELLQLGREDVPSDFAQLPEDVDDGDFFLELLRIQVVYFVQDIEDGFQRFLESLLGALIDPIQVYVQFDVFLLGLFVVG